MLDNLAMQSKLRTCANKNAYDDKQNGIARYGFKESLERSFKASLYVDVIITRNAVNVKSNAAFRRFPALND